MGQDRPLYVISVAAEFTEMHPQTLRLYERKGLINPRRSAGNTRLYSQADIERLHEIRRLTQELGLNLAGVEEILRLQEELSQLKESLEAEINSLETALREHLEEFSFAPALPAPGTSALPARGDKDRPLYVISVAAELAQMHPQTLRLYERKGLINPRRSAGNTRLYSQADIERLHEIRRLTQELGLNLAGVEEILRLQEELEAVKNGFFARLTQLRLRLLQSLHKEKVVSISQSLVSGPNCK